MVNSVSPVAETTVASRERHVFRRVTTRRLTRARSAARSVSARCCRAILHKVQVFTMRSSARVPQRRETDYNNEKAPVSRRPSQNRSVAALQRFRPMALRGLTICEGRNEPQRGCCVSPHYSGFAHIVLLLSFALPCENRMLTHGTRRGQPVGQSRRFKPMPPRLPRSMADTVAKRT
jgi:hypothetical protein